METQAQKAKMYYDEWFNSQNRFMQNWLDTNQNFHKAVAGSLPEGASRDYYKQWSEQQLGMYRNWLDAASRMQTQFPQQGNFNFPTMPHVEGTLGSFKDMMEKQMRYMQGMMSSAPSYFQNPTENFNRMRSEGLNQLFALYDSWMGITKNIAAMFGPQFEQGVQNLHNTFNKENFSTWLNSGDTYMKVLEFWMPLYKAMQDKNMSLETLQQYMRPERYKEVLDRVFEFATPELMQNFFGQANKVMESLGYNVQSTMGRYNEMLQRNAKLLPELMSGDPQAAMRIYENMYEAYQKNLDPMVRASLNGRDGELMDILKDITAKYVDYASRLSKFQYKVYVTGQKAMEQVVEKSYSTYKDSKEAGSYNDFFKQWVATNEQAYNDVFKTEEFTQLQSELMNANLDIRGDFQRLMELALADYPVVPRSEMDELYKTVHELKAKLRSLDKTNGAEAQSPVPVPEAEGVPAKRPAAKKA